jgi:hypothetical protein
VTSTPPTRLRCRRCGGSVDRAARRCPHCGGPGPGPGSAWLRRSRLVAIVALGVILGAIGLSIALAGLGGMIGGDAAEAALLVVVLVTVPAFLLLVPVLIVVAALEYAGNRAYRGKPIVAAWDVHFDGEIHAVSLPASPASAPDHAWVDGERVPLEWTPPGATTARAELGVGTFSGALRVWTDAREVAADVVVGVLSAALGAPVGGGPALRYALEIDGAAVEAIPVADGERRSQADHLASGA